MDMSSGTGVDSGAEVGCGSWASRTSRESKRSWPARSRPRGRPVGAAGDGREGLRLATAARWDLVVLDLLLPGLNGLQVLRELHRTKPELPVVILSARSDVQTKLRGFELGATD